MAINKVEICGVDTSTLPVLKHERMRELFPNPVISRPGTSLYRAICGWCSVSFSDFTTGARVWTICFRSVALD